MENHSDQMNKFFSFIVCLFLSFGNVLSQNYHAIQGSSYAGSLGVGNNPASIADSPYPWDINLFSFQGKSSTNAVTVLRYSLLSSPKASRYRIDNGDYPRYGNGNFNIHFLNTRFAMGRNQAVA